MIAKKFLIALLVCFACFFMACDDSTSASEDAVEESSKSVDSIYELGKCTDKLEGETRLVTKENAYYLCTEKEWVRTVAVKSSSSSVDSSSSEEKSSSSSGKKTDKFIFINIKKFFIKGSVFFFVKRKI